MKRRRPRASEKSRLVSLNVKLARPHKRPPATLKRLPGVVQVTQTFPDERGEELSTLYVLQADATRAEAVLRTLNQDPSVAYAEVSAPRKALGAAVKSRG